MSYYLVYGCIPICCSNLDLAKLIYRTDKVVTISKKKFDFVEREYLIYKSAINHKLRLKNKY